MLPQMFEKRSLRKIISFDSRMLHMNLASVSPYNFILKMKLSRSKYIERK